MKRFLALLLSVLMLTALLPFSVWAEEPEEELPAAQTEPAEPAPDAEQPAPDTAEEPAPVKEPEQPEASEQTAEPAAPEEPSEEPEQTAEPAEPEAPEQSEEPEQPEEPSVSEAPEQSEEPEQPEEPAVPEEPEQPEGPAEETVITVAPLQNAVLRDGAAELVCRASVNAKGVKLFYRWQRLDTGIEYETALARAEAWEDIPGAGDAKLAFEGIDEETYEAEYAQLLYRCIVRTEDDAEISTEAKLLPDPLWATQPEEEPEELTQAPEEDPEEEPAEPEAPAEPEEEPEAPAAEEESEIISAEAPEQAEELPAGESDPLPAEGGYALLADMPITLSVSVSPEGAGTVSGNLGEYGSDETAELTAAPAQGYLFAGWYVDPVKMAGGDLLSTDLTYSFSPAAIYNAYQKSFNFTVSTEARFTLCGHTGYASAVIQEGYLSDESGHWNAVCQGCRAPVNYTAHADTNGDGFCDTCGFEMPVAQGTDGEAITWKLSASGVLTFSGTGPMTDYDFSSDIPWYGYAKNVTSAVIGKGITAIGGNTFLGCVNLASVDIADSVTVIGYGAFSTSGLTSFEVPSSITSIKTGAFSSCQNLTSVIIPGSVVSMGEHVFGNSKKLTSAGPIGGKYNIQFGWTKTIPANSFSNHTDLATVTVPAGITGIGAGAFSDHGNTYLSLTFTGSAPSFENCFSNTRVKAYYPANDASWTEDVRQNYGAEKMIWNAYTGGACGNSLSWRLFDGTLFIEGSGAMNDCDPGEAPWYPLREEITAVNMDTCTAGRIGDNAFYGLSRITSAVIPDTVRSIGDSAFSGCSALLSVTVPGSVTAVGSNVFAGDTKLTSAGPLSGEDHIRFGWTEAFPANAFFGCDSLKTITVPATIASVGDYAFRSCNYLKTVCFMGTEAQWTELMAHTGIFNSPFRAANVLFASAAGTCGVSVSWVLSTDGTLTVTGRGAMYDYAYAASEPWAESNGSIKTVVIADGVTGIGMNAFTGGNKITKVTLPRSVTSIGEAAFNDCTAITDVYYAGTAAEWSEISVGTGNTLLTSAAVHYAGQGTFGDFTWTLDRDGKLTVTGSGNMPDFSLAGAPWYSKIDEIRSVVFDGDITSVGKHAFEMIPRLSSVVLPNGVKKIGYEAFCDCTGLTSVTIPAGVTQIDDAAFKGCSSLISVTVPESAGTLGSFLFEDCTALTSATLLNRMETLPVGIFEGCTALTSVTFPQGLTRISVDAFKGCSSLTSVALPAGITSIYERAFEGCSSLTSVALPAGVRGIDESTFSGCTALAAITVPISVRSIGESAFSGCTGLATVSYGGSITQWNALRNAAGTGNEALFSADVLCDNSGSWGDNLTWDLTDGVLTLSGTGPMQTAKKVSDLPWYAHRDETASLVLCEGITTISSMAFSGTPFTSVTLPESLTSIGGNAFTNCANFTSIDIPANVTYIAHNAFFGCQELTAVTGMEGLTAFSESLFLDCRKLTSVDIPAGLTKIEKWAFSCCCVFEGTLTLKFKGGAPAFNEECFSTACLKVYYPAADTSWTEDVRRSYDAKEIEWIPYYGGAAGPCLEWDIRDGVLVISGTGPMYDYSEQGAPWANCTDMYTSVSVGAGVTCIGTNALVGCGHVTVLTFEGDAPAFHTGCFTGFESVVSYPEANQTWTEAVRQDHGGDPIWIPEADFSCGEHVTWSFSGGVLHITGTGSMSDHAPEAEAPWAAGREKICSVTIDEGVAYVGAYAFSQCTALNEVSLPGSVTQIGANAFAGCTGLATVRYGGSIAQWTALQPSVGTGNGALTGANILYTDSGTCGDSGVSWALEGNALTITGSGAMPDYSDDVPAPWAAYKTAIKSVSIGAGVTKIGECAFKDCGALTSVTFAEDSALESIGDSAFAYCSALTFVTIPASVTSIGRNAFEVCYSLSSVPFAEGSKLESIGDGAFNGCEALTSVTVPALVTGIGEAAFSSCNKLASVTFAAGSKLESIGESAFDQCMALKEITLPASIKILGIKQDGKNIARVFSDCKSLASVTFADGSKLESIGTEMFKGCTALKAVTVPASVTSIGGQAFIACSSLESVTFADGSKLESIGECAFKDCGALASVTLPASVISIEKNTFEGCRALTSVAFTGSAPAIAENCFKDVTATVLIPENDTSWTEEKKQNYGGTLTWVETDFDHAEELTLSHDYLLLEKGGTAQLSAVITPETYVGSPVWTSEDGSVAAVTEKGLVTAVGAGTTYITASVISEGRTVSASCRVDVAEPEPPVQEQVSAVQLITASATAYVYKTADLATVTVLPVLAQNKNKQSGETASGAGKAITAARFAADAVNTYFTLRVKDDRTLEIVPTEKAVSDAKAGSKAFKSAYTSKLTVTVDGKEFTTSGSLKLTVKKTKPSVKARAVVLNSWPAALGEETELTFSGAEVTGMTLTKAAPAWLTVDTENRTLALSPETVPAKYTSGKLTFSCEIDGWAVPAALTVSYSVKKTAPVLKYGTKTVKLMPGTPDTVQVAVYAAKAPFTDTEKYPVTVTKIEQLVGKAYKDIAGIDPDLLSAELTDGILTLSAPQKPDDFKAHTYRITLSCAGKTFAYPVKTLAPAAATMTVKSTGSINSKVDLSETVLTVTPKNFHAGVGEVYSLVKIQRYAGKKLQEEYTGEAADIVLPYTQEENVFTFRGGDLVSGSTYKAVIGVDLDGDGALDGTVTATLKITFPKTAPKASVSAKAKGAIDVTRPGSAITLSYSMKNLYFVKEIEILFYKKEGKTFRLLSPAESPFSYTSTGDLLSGTYTVTAGEKLNEATGVYYASVKVWPEHAEVLESSRVKLTVKKGAVKVKSSVTSAVLYKNDRFSRVPFTLTVADETVAPIERVELDAVSAKKFRLIGLGNNTWALEYKDSTLPASFKASTVKLYVYVEGCRKSAATVSMKVSYK